MTDTVSLLCKLGASIHGMNTLSMVDSFYMVLSNTLSYRIIWQHMYNFLSWASFKVGHWSYQPFPSVQWFKVNISIDYLVNDSSMQFQNLLQNLKEWPMKLNDYMHVP